MLIPSSRLQYRSVIAAIAATIVAAAPGAAHAACTWTPALVMTQLSGEESHGFHFSWSTTFAGACPTIDHFRVAIDDAGTPSGPGMGDLGGSTSAGVLNLRPHRAQRHYDAKIWACKNSDCSSVFGTGAGEAIIRFSASSDVAGLSTAQEEWSIVGMDGDGPENVGIDAFTSDANDVSSFFYPGGWTYGGTLAVYGRDFGNRSVLQSRAAVSGWTNFNTVEWETDTSADSVEVFGSHESDADYDDVSHVYAYPVTDGTAEFIEVLAQNAGTSLQVVWAQSTDDVGDDFGSSFTTSTVCYGAGTACDWPAAETAGVAGIALDPGDWGFDSLLHGRWMWSVIANGPPDLSTDTPSILVTGGPDGSTCADVDSDDADTDAGPDDIYMATWDPSAGWEMVDGPDGGSCPDVLIADAHDPGVTPLPSGDFKIYVVTTSTHEVRTYYYHAGAIEVAYATPVFDWDPAGSIHISHGCLANIDSFAFVDGSGPHEGMFVYVHQGGTFQSSSCTGGLVNANANDNRMFFAELQN